MSQFALKGAGLTRFILLSVLIGSASATELKQHFQERAFDGFMDSPPRKFSVQNISPEFKSKINFPKNKAIEACKSAEELSKPESTVTNYTLLCVFIRAKSFLRKRTIKSEEDHLECLNKGYARLEFDTRALAYSKDQEQACVNEQSRELIKIFKNDELNALLKNTGIKKTKINLKSYSELSLKARVKPYYGLEVGEELVIIPALLNKRCSIVTSNQIAQHLRDYRQRVYPLGKGINEVQSLSDGPQDELEKKSCAHLVQINEKTGQSKLTGSSELKATSTADSN